MKFNCLLKNSFDLREQFQGLSFLLQEMLALMVTVILMQLAGHCIWSQQ